MGHEGPFAVHQVDPTQHDLTDAHNLCDEAEQRFRRRLA